MKNANDLPQHIINCLHAIWQGHQKGFTITDVYRIYHGCQSLDETLRLVEAGIKLNSTHLIYHT